MHTSPRSRRSSRASLPALFAALVFPLVIALVFAFPSVSVLAQTATTTPTTPAASAMTARQPDAASGNTYIKDEHKAEKKSEAEEMNEYRHSPTVTWFAKVLNIDVETAAKGFEYINFAIIVLAVGIPLFKMLPGVFKKRSARLSFEIEVAQAKTADANTRLTAVEATLAGLDAEISAFRKQVEDEMREDEARSKALIEEETARIVASAEQEISVAGAMAERGLRQFAADLAIDRAMSQLTLDAESDRALFAEFAHDVAGSHASKRSSKGGQS